MACYNREIRELCHIKQDDNTCTYDTSRDGKCVCGGTLIDAAQGDKCYADDECGAHGNVLQDCSSVLGEKDSVEGPCEPRGNEINATYCAKGTQVLYDYNTISGERNIKCIGKEMAEVKGCKDPKAIVSNLFAAVPGKCNYN